METRTKIAIGTAAALAAGAAFSGPAQADQPVPAATSYADLLSPVPDAGARLRLADAQYAEQPARFEDVQYAPHHHHHHHHHHHDRRWYLQNGYYWNNGGWMRRPVHHYHHHHHDHY